jgi:hypothetical protein
VIAIGELLRRVPNVPFAHFERIAYGRTCDRLGHHGSERPSIVGSSRLRWRCPVVQLIPDPTTHQLSPILRRGQLHPISTRYAT